MTQNPHNDDSEKLFHKADLDEALGSWTSTLDDLIAFGFGNLAVKFKGRDLGKVKDFKKLGSTVGPSITLKTFNYLLKKGGLKHDHKRNRAELGSKSSKYTKGSVELTEGEVNEAAIPKLEKELEKVILKYMKDNEHTIPNITQTVKLFPFSKFAKYYKTKKAAGLAEPQVEGKVNEGLKVKDWHEETRPDQIVVKASNGKTLEIKPKRNSSEKSYQAWLQALDQYKTNPKVASQIDKALTQMANESVLMEYSDQELLKQLMKARAIAAGNKQPGLVSGLQKHISKLQKKMKKAKTNEASRGKIHKAVKKGSYPVTIVVISNGMAIKQELVKTPEAVPAAFNELQKQYPNANLSIEDNTGKRLFSESVNEAEFKHISKDEHKIKLAIKDVEKKSRLKANRDKTPEYEQIALNKIMLSKVLGREKLSSKYKAAWEKLKKEYDLKESKTMKKNSPLNEVSTISKRRAGAELKQKIKGKRSDGLGPYTATIYGMSGGKRVELKSLNDLNKYSEFEIDESVKISKSKVIETISKMSSNPDEVLEGLWDNIRKKKARGGKTAKPGDKDYPDDKAWDDAQESVNEDELTEIRKGDYIGTGKEIGKVNKVSGSGANQVAYVKFDSRPKSFIPILARNLTKTGKKHKGKDLYQEGKVNEAVKPIKLSGNLKKDLDNVTHMATKMVKYAKDNFNTYIPTGHMLSQLTVAGYKEKDVLKYNIDHLAKAINTDLKKKYMKDFMGESVNEASSLFKKFDDLMNLRMKSMDVEQTIMDREKELKQLYMDMEQEAEPEGGPKASAYGKRIESLTKILNKDKAILSYILRKIDKLDQY